MIVQEAIWTHYYSNDASQTIRNRTQKRRNVYGDINFDLCCRCRCCYCASLVCSDWLFKKPFEISSAFERPFDWLVNMYRFNSDQMNEDKIIITIVLIKECSLLANEDSLLCLPLRNCGFKSQFLDINATDRCPQTYFLGARLAHDLSFYQNDFSYFIKTVLFHLHPKLLIFPQALSYNTPSSSLSCFKFPILNMYNK